MADFNEVIQGFWKTHTIGAWAIETEIENGTIKATIKFKGQVLVTAHSDVAHDNPGLARSEQQAIQNAIAMLLPTQ